MKKNFYFLVMFSLFLGIMSCKQETDPEYPITGDWKPVEDVTTTVTNGQSQSTITPYTACEQKSKMTITTDNKGHYSYFGVNATTANCEELMMEDFTYVYDKNAKTFTVKENTDVTVFQVIKLNDTELQIKETDYDIPTAPVSTTTLFRRY